jgi:hypothetical protein
MWLKLKSKKLWLKRKDKEEEEKKRREECEQIKIKNPMKDFLFPFSYPYKSIFPFEQVYQQTSTGPGISMDPQKNVGLGGGVP